MSLFACPHCQKNVTVANGQRGATIACPKCGGGFRTPATEDDPLDVSFVIVPPSPSRYRAAKKSGNNSTLAYIGAFAVGLAFIAGVVVYRIGATKVFPPADSTAKEKTSPRTPTPARLPPVAVHPPAQAKPLPPTWIADAEDGLAEYQRYRKVNPRLDDVDLNARPETVTKQEYSLYRVNSSIWERQFGTKEPPSGSVFGFLLLLNLVRNGTNGAAFVYPRHFAVWQREWEKQFLDSKPTDHSFEVCINVYHTPSVRRLMQRQVQEEYARRSAWSSRKALFQKLAAITKDNRPWNLFHPFDDLNAEEMDGVVKAAQNAEAIGLGVLSRKEWGLLLSAGQDEFFGQRLAEANHKFNGK
jgi:hypothetical protein